VSEKRMHNTGPIRDEVSVGNGGMERSGNEVESKLTYEQKTIYCGIMLAVKGRWGKMMRKVTSGPIGGFEVISGLTPWIVSGTCYKDQWRMPLAM